jgi:hypothetical protein
MADEPHLMSRPRLDPCARSAAARAMPPALRLAPEALVTPAPSPPLKSPTSARGSKAARFDVGGLFSSAPAQRALVLS